MKLKPTIEMRKLLVALLLPAAFSATAQLNNGLVGHWTFTAGNTADISGNMHDGTIQGTVTGTTDRSGGSGCAMLFPGTASRIAVPYSTDFDIAPSGAFTISLWYQGGSVEAGDLEYLFAKRDPAMGNHNSDYSVDLYDLNRVLGSVGDQGALWSTIVPPVPDPVWHHVAYIYANGLQQIWLDNVQVADTMQQAVVSQSGQGIIIGERFEGAIDDIRFYDRDLSAIEVGLLFQETASCTSTGIATSAAPSITVAPNPTNGTLTLYNPSFANPRLRQIELFDATGRPVYSSTAKASTTTLHLDEFPNGLYLLRIGTGTDAVVRRIVKQ